MSDPPQHTTASRGDQHGAHGAFVWPPRAVAAAGAPEPVVERPQPSAPDHPGRRAASEWLVEVERFWLSPTAEPLERRIRAAGWSPDALGAYCNRCGMTIGPYEADEFGCSACRGVRCAWERFVRLGSYESPLADWIKEVKFTRWRSLGGSLGRMLGRAARDAGILGGAGADGARIAVVPVPTTMRRRLSRGVDHARVIARGVARELRAPLVAALVCRRHRPSQRSLPPSERTRAAAGAFALRRGVDLAGWTVLVVDDVRTTGATLGAAARALGGRAGGVGGGAGRPAAIWAAALGVTPDPHRGRAADTGDAREPPGGGEDESFAPNDPKKGESGRLDRGGDAAKLSFPLRKPD